MSVYVAAGCSGGPFLSFCLEFLMTGFKRRLSNAWHNIVLHPIAGVCWFVGLTRLGDWLHGEEKPHWWIMRFDNGFVRFLAECELAERPDFAAPAGDDPFTPWEQTADHLHVHRDEVLGAHVYAANKEEAYLKALELLIQVTAPVVKL